MPPVALAQVSSRKYSNTTPAHAYLLPSVAVVASPRQSTVPRTDHLPKSASGTVALTTVNADDVQPTSPHLKDSGTSATYRLTVADAGPESTPADQPASHHYPSVPRSLAHQVPETSGSLPSMSVPPQPPHPLDAIESDLPTLSLASNLTGLRYAVHRPPHLVD